MKCNIVLKKYYSERVSNNYKEKINEHVSTCPFCQEKLELSENIGSFLREQHLPENNNLFWTDMQRDIRLYRDKVQDNWWLRISELLPVKKIAYIGAFASLIIMLSISITNDRAEKAQLIKNAEADLDFFMQEHILTQGTNMFEQADFTATRKYAKSDTSRKRYRNE